MTTRDTSSDSSSPLSVVGRAKALTEEIRMIACVAGQCSVEGPENELSLIAADEADRCSRWAAELDHLVAEVERLTGQGWQPMGREHELKTWPEFYEEVATGRKRFEIRLNDRHFQVGDVLWLREYTVGVGLSGRSSRHQVTYVTDWNQHPGYVVLGISAALPAPPEDR